MKNSKTKLLLLGIGNSSRQDDGLGWAFLDELKKNETTEIEFVYKYQLNIEDAELISTANRVIFIDAFNGILAKGFSFKECIPSNTFEFTTHSLNPGVIIALCQNLYDVKPKAFVLNIQGLEWGLKEGLTKVAYNNLYNALNFFRNKLNTSFSL